MDTLTPPTQSLKAIGLGRRSAVFVVAVWKAAAVGVAGAIWFVAACSQSGVPASIGMVEDSGGVGASLVMVAGADRCRLITCV